MFKYYEEAIRQMELELEELAQEAFRRHARHNAPRESIWQPRTDVYECSDSVIIKVELAGVDASRIDITLSPDSHQLVIRGARQESRADHGDRVRCYQLEIYYGAFERVVRLPSDLRLDRDRLSARYVDGFLFVTLPKRKPDPPRSVPIES